MAGRESVATLGAKRSRLLRNRLADELATARLAGGLSVRDVARRVGVSPGRIERAERADPSALTVDLAARIAPVVGLQLAATLIRTVIQHAIERTSLCSTASTAGCIRAWIGEPRSQCRSRVTCEAGTA
jgi:transcriptional regulator with XRE-family HTH domain